MKEQIEIDKLFMKKAIDLALLGSGFVNPLPLEAAIIGCDVGNPLIREYRATSAVSEQVILKALSAFIQWSEPDIESKQSHETNVFTATTTSITTATTTAITTSTTTSTNNTLYVVIDADYTAMLSDTIDQEALRQLCQDAKAKGLSRMVVGLNLPVALEKSSFASFAQSIGIEVVQEVMSEECRELNEIYYHYSKYKKPFVFVKWAMTLDGKLATYTGDSKWISSEGSLNFVHHLRQRVAAIMVGEGTVIMDDPLLTTRLEGVELSHPIRVIVSKYGNIPDQAKVLRVSERVKTLFLVSDKIPEERERFLLDCGVEIMKFHEVNGHISFEEIIERLGEIGVDSLYIEGGSAILGEAFEHGVINKVYAAIAPKIVGGKNAITPVGGKGIARMADAIELNNVSYEIIGRDVIMKGYI